MITNIRLYTVPSLDKYHGFSFFDNIEEENNIQYPAFISTALIDLISNAR
jgi:hypothetical protein